MIRSTAIATTLVLLFGSVLAQDLTPSTTPKNDAGSDRVVVREQTVYVPYRQIKKVFEEEGRGIFLPYEEFLKLWRSANPNPPDIKKTEPPAAAVIRSSPYKGSVDGDLARFEVTYQVDSLKDGWSELSVPLQDIAVESVDLGDSNAIFWARDKGYSLLLPGKGSFQVTVRFAVSVGSAPGRKTLSFGIPPVGVSSVELTIPEKEARIDVEPKTAALTESKEGDDKTKIVAHLGNAKRFVVNWMPPVGQAAEDAAALIAEQFASARLEERVLETETTIVYKLARGQVDQFRVQIPTNDDTQLLSVKGQNIRRWNVEGDRLDVELHSPVKDAYQLSLQFERNVADGTANVNVALPKMQNVLRETGWLALAHDPALRVTIDSQTGFSQLDPEEVPQSLRQHLRVGFQYLAPPPPLALGVSKIEPVIRSRTVSVVTLGRERDDWSGFVDFEITKAGVFSVALQIPERFTVEEIGDASTVDDYQSSEVANTLRTVTVNLRSRALGSFRLPFKFTAEGSATPGEKTVHPPLVVGTKQDQGLFGIAAPRSLDIRTKGDEGLSSVEQSELVQSGILSRISADAGEPQAYAYQRNTTATRARLDVELAEKQEEVQVVAQHLISVTDSGRIKLTHFLDYEILYKARRTLEFSAPSNLEGELRFHGEQISETPQAEAQPNGISRWTVQLQAEVEGRVPLTITHEIAPEVLEDGVAKTVAIPFVVPRAGVYKSRSGFVAVSKSGNLEVNPVPTNLDVIDESQLTGKLRGAPVLAAYSYAANEPTLGLELTRYKAVPLARTATKLLHVKAVLSKKPAMLKAIATLVVQNSSAQPLEVELPDRARTENVYVNGHPVTTKQRQNSDTQLIPIPRSQGHATFPVVIVYDQALGDEMGSTGSQSISLPSVRETEAAPIPVQRVELDLHVPQEYTYLSWSGNLQARATRDTMGSKFSHIFSAAFGDSPSGGARSLPTTVPAVDAAFERTLDGTELHTFSTMGRDATLRVRYISPSLYLFLQVIFFVGALVGGFVLVRRIELPEIGVVVAILATSLVIAWFLESGMAGFFSASFYGGIVLGIGFFAMRVKTAVDEWRMARLSLAPDPYLEDALEEPPEKPAEEKTAEEASESKAEESDSGSGSDSDSGSGSDSDSAKKED